MRRLPADVVEDTGVALDEIRARFGDQVAQLVAAVTKTDEISATPLEEQAPKVLALARTGGPDGVALEGADLLANGTDLVLDAEEPGVAYLETIFGGDRVLPKLGHYLRLADLMPVLAQQVGECPPRRSAGRDGHQVIGSGLVGLGAQREPLTLSRRAPTL